MCISIEDQKAILKRYLDFFFVPLAKQDILLYKKQYPEIKNYYIQHNLETLKKIGCYLLLLRGNEKYKLYNSYELFQKYIGANEESKDWLDLKTPLIFLYYPAFTEQNKKILEILGHLISHRKLNNLITIVLTEVPLLQLKDIIDSLNKEVITNKPVNISTVDKIPKNIEIKKINVIKTKKNSFM